MPDQLTAAHFDDTMRAIADTLAVHTDRFDRIDATLADHTARLDRLEKLLTLERRVELIDERTRKLAEIAGHPELSTANF